MFNDGDKGTRVKQLELIPDQAIILHSDNKSEHPPETRIGKAMNAVADGVVGEVVWSGHKWI